MERQVSYEQHGLGRPPPHPSSAQNYLQNHAASDWNSPSHRTYGEQVNQTPACCMDGNFRRRCKCFYLIFVYQVRYQEGLHAYENPGSSIAGHGIPPTPGTTRTSGRIFGNHRRSPSNVSNSSVTTNSSNINHSFRLEDEIDPQFSCPPVVGQRVAFDLDPRKTTIYSPSQTCSPIRSTRQAPEVERPGTLVKTKEKWKTCGCWLQKDS